MLLSLTACVLGPVSVGDEVAEPCPEGNCLTDPEDADVRIGWSQVAVASNGFAWVSFVEVDGPRVVGLYLTWSAGPGLPLVEPIAVPFAEPPNIGTTEKPSLSVTDDQVALVYTGTGQYRHGDADALYLQTATVRDGEVTFDPIRTIDDLGGNAFVVEHGRVAHAPDGELWVMWKRQEYGVSDHAMWARSSEAFQPTLVSEALSSKHDCSPPDFRIDASGSPLLGMRNNIDGWLETMAVFGDNPADPQVVRLSNDDWRYSEAVCPEDGPRLLRLSDGTLFSGWLAPTDFAWRMASSWSVDDGQTWTTPDKDHDGVELGETWIAAVAVEDGGFHTAVEQLEGTTRLFTRESPGTVTTERLLQGDDGMDLTGVELAAGGGRAVAVGTTEDRTLWLVEL